MPEQAEGQHVHASGGHAGAVGHASVLRDGAHEQAQARVVEQDPDQRHHGQREADDDQAVVAEHQSAQHRDAARHPARIADLHVLRAEQAAHALHQHQADAPGRQQRFQGPAVEPADHGAFQRHAHQRRDQEGQRQRRRHVPIQPARQPGAEQRLHHIGNVGADHQQLAMRHIDHAHQPEGDGQPQRRQQQHAAQAQAVEEIACPFDGGQAAVDAAQRVGGGLAHAGVGFGIGAVALLHQGRQHGTERGVVTAAQQFHGMTPRGRIGALQFQPGLRDLQRGAHGRVAFRGQRLRDQGQPRGIVGLLQAARGEPRAGIGRVQLRAGQRCLDGAAQAVVDADGRGSRRQVQRGAAGRVGGAGAITDQHAAVRRRVELVGAQARSTAAPSPPGAPSAAIARSLASVSSPASGASRSGRRRPPPRAAPARPGTGQAGDDAGSVRSQRCA